MIRIFRTSLLGLALSLLLAANIIAQESEGETDNEQTEAVDAAAPEENAIASEAAENSAGEEAAETEQPAAEQEADSAEAEKPENEDAESDSEAGEVAAEVATKVAAARVAKEEDLIGYDVDLSGYYKVRYNFIDVLDLNKDKKFAGVERKFSNRDKADYPAHYDYPLTDRAHNVDYFSHRFRLQPTLQINEMVKLAIEINAFEHYMELGSGKSAVEAIEPYKVWGDRDGTVLLQSTADEESNVIISRAWTEVMLPFGVLKVGRMASRFGMGAFSNDGEHTPMWGDAKYGDTYDRILFGTKPLGAGSDFFIAVLADKIVEGKLAYEGTGDDVDEYGLVAFYNAKPVAGGIYGIWRRQESSHTSAYIVDGYLKLDFEFISFETEAFYIMGETKAIPLLHPEFPDYLDIVVEPGDNLTKPKMKLNAVNWVFNLGLNFEMVPYVGLTGGYLSGDEGGSAGNPLADKEISSLALDPDFNVGLIMFEQAMAYKSVIGTMNKLREVDDNRDILLAAGESKSEIGDLEEIIADLGPTKGAAKNAIFLNPAIAIEPVEGLKIQFAFLWAIAAVPYEDYVYDKKTGTLIFIEDGEEQVDIERSRHFRKKYAKTKKVSDYGYEFDIGIGYDFTDNFNVGLQAGYFLPGEVFNKPDGSGADNAFSLQTRFTVSF